MTGTSIPQTVHAACVRNIDTGALDTAALLLVGTYHVVDHGHAWCEELDSPAAPVTKKTSLQRVHANS